MESCWIEVYADAGGAWRWRIKSRNGRVVARSDGTFTERKWALASSTGLVGELKAGDVNIRVLETFPADEPETVSAPGAVFARVPAVETPEPETEHDTGTHRRRRRGGA